MAKKRGLKGEMKVYFVIANIVLAIFAFSWMVGAQDSATPENGISILPTATGTGSPVTKVGEIAKIEFGNGYTFPGIENPAYGAKAIGGENWALLNDKGEVIGQTTKQILKDSNLNPELFSQGYNFNLGTSNNIEIGGKTINGLLLEDKKVFLGEDGILYKQTDKGTWFNSGTGVPKAGSQLSEFLLSESSYGTWLDGALSGVQYAAMWYGIGQLVGSLIGLEKEQTAAVSEALAGGAFTYGLLAKTTDWGIAKGIFVKQGTGVFGSQIGAMGAGIIVGVIIFAVRYKETSTETVTFSCQPWQAPTGGNDCERCNENPDTCNEYRCKSLGQSCQIVNTESETEKKCVWVNPQDVKSPGISPWEDVLTEGYSYADVRIRPPGEGSEPGRMRIVKEGSADGCVEAFTPLKFGIVTLGPDGEDEPAQCRIDYNHTLKYEDMTFDFGGKSFYLYNHSQQLALPSPSAISSVAPELQHDGTYTLYVRCRDANGNENVDEFVIRFCVDAGPDTTPPKIEGTSIANEMPVKFNQTNVDLDVYVNEPAECKWSREDRDYDNMEYSMECKNKVWEMNNNMVYTCKTTLTGVSDRQENKFFFRCKDKPDADENERNTMMESYEFMLAGTEPLNIISIKPNGTVKGSTEVVSVNIEVETANGYKNGDAVCYYSDTGKDSDWIEFFDTGTESHKQRLDLTEGEYKYYVKCLDLGGNREDNFTEFKVEVDRNAPNVVRVYEENSLLKVVTDEDSECRYSTRSCNFKFEDGIDMPYANQTEHVAEWKTESTYYIRCADAYGSMPLPNSCSIVVRPYDIVEQKVEE